MSVEILDSTTVLNFLEDEEAFDLLAHHRFRQLDTDNDGLLSYTDMLKEFHSLRVLEKHYGVDVKTEPDELARVYGSIFSQFDRDASGTVDLEEFKEETKRMMVAVANGLGFLPVQMVVEEDGFLKKAVDMESAKLAA